MGGNIIEINVFQVGHNYRPLEILMSEISQVYSHSYSQFRAFQGDYEHEISLKQASCFTEI